jgi:heme O synthase-like polyprenyltransferase
MNRKIIITNAVIVICVFLLYYFFIYRSFWAAFVSSLIPVGMIFWSTYTARKRLDRWSGGNTR